MMKQLKGNLKKKRIRNVAIVFLVVALALTFFSNTIMNASLPEITAQYVIPETITERISGSGTVEANQASSVTASVPGQIKKLAVESGDVLEIGDLICTITPDMAGDDADGGEGGYDDAYYTALRFYLDEGQDYDDAVKSLDTRKSALLSQIYKTYHISEGDTVSAKGAAIRTEQNTLTNSLTYVSAESYEKLPQAYQSGIAQAVQGQKSADSAVEQANEALSDAQGKLTGSSDSQQELIDDAKKAMDQAYEDYLTAFYAYQDAVSSGSEEAEMLEEASDAAYAAYEDSVDAHEDAVAELSKIQSQEAAVSSAENRLESANNAKERADQALTDALEDATTAITRDQTILSLVLLEIGADNMVYNEDGTVSVYAESAGIVAAISVSSGDTVMQSDPIAEIVQADGGYTVHFNVSAEKARKVRPGAQASVINADATATLKSIRNAANSESGQMDEKTLYFTVTGDVTVGQSLAVKLDENSQNYDYTVPSSALGEDNNGTFVLAVQTKSTPLGNRYYAKRIDVEVLADDGTNAAINGNIDMDTYVICISTKALEDGDMVRMKETSE